jgi:hypothetical protein
MGLFGLQLLTLLASFHQGVAINCPLGGPEFPPPRNLAGNPTWQAAMRNLTSFFENFDVNGVDGASGSRPSNYSYAVRLFSSNPSGPDVLWERYHTAENLPTDSPGVKKVDGDTIFRTGSISKLFTVLAILAEDGFTHFDVPITQFVPELAALKAKQAADPDPIMHVDWDDVTLATLASQMSGLVRDCELDAEVVASVSASD